MIKKRRRASQRKRRRKRESGRRKRKLNQKRKNRKKRNRSGQERNEHAPLLYLFINTCTRAIICNNEWLVLTWTAKTLAQQIQTTMAGKVVLRPEKKWIKEREMIRGSLHTRLCTNEQILISQIEVEHFERVSGAHSQPIFWKLQTGNGTVLRQRIRANTHFQIPYLLV